MGLNYGIIVRHSAYLWRDEYCHLGNVFFTKKGIGIIGPTNKSIGMLEAMTETELHDLLKQLQGE